MEDRWLSVSEIALYLGIKRDTVYKWIDRRSMPSHKVGRLWKFRQGGGRCLGSFRWRSWSRP